MGLFGFEKVPPAPLAILQMPVPTTGLFATRFTEVTPHIATQSVKPRSGPALAVVGLGLTVTSTVKGLLLQPLAMPVIVKVVVCGLGVLLFKVPVIVVPLPLAGIPVTSPVLFLTHENVVPATLFGFRILIALNAIPEQTIWLTGVALTVGLGLTVTVTVVDEEQPADELAVIVKVVVCAVLVVFVKLPVIVLPFPFAAIPVRFEVLSLTQENVVPATLLGLVMLIVLIAFSEQIVCVAGAAFTVGRGFTITLAVVIDVQPAGEVAVIVNVVVCCVLVVLVNVPAIELPVPLAAIPVRLAVLFLTHEKVVPLTLFGFVMLIIVIGLAEQTV